MALKMDLHIHSTYSDGMMKPVELVRKYHEEEYNIIALTDHDGVSGVKEAKIAGEALGIQVISGIELDSAFRDGISLHILGYYLDVENPALTEKLEELLQNRAARNEKLLAVFQDMGYAITMDDLKQRPDQTYIGKPNFALALHKKGYIASPKDAFEEGKFLESEEARAVTKDKISTQEAIKLIQEAGGVSSLAHPMKIRKIGEKGSEEFFENLDSLLRELKKCGLKSMECFHPSATHEQALRLVRLADKYKLHITQGSDYHGPAFE